MTSTFHFDRITLMI